MDATTENNPLLAAWTGPFAAPPFDRLKPDHFMPAFTEAFVRARAEIDAIAANPEEPTFENTIAALERAGEDLTRVSLTFFNLAGADTNDALEEVERDIAPLLSRHRSATYLNEDLFRRIESLREQGEKLGLDAEQARVLERYHIAFSRNGGGLPQEAKARLAAIAERLATLGTQFSQNVLADEKAYRLVLETPEDLAGLPPSLIAAAAGTAAELGLPGKYVITLARSSIEPFLQFSARRDLREQAFRAWAMRGENGGASDNRAIAAEMVKLRAERAKLLGYETFAHFKLADTMAKTPKAARDLLQSVWEPARARALKEQAALRALAASEGGNFEIAAWDWRYYAEKQRKAEYDLDEGETKPYLQLGKLVEAAFHAAEKLFGLTFTERFDIPLYHKDARAWTVSRDGAEIALFIGDYFARPSKHSGAWMSLYREQQKLDGTVLPIVVNVLNFARGGEGEACLLSFDDARTLFHEFGHALHGMLSDVTYPLISGTSVARDFVEFPSQLYEHWLEQPEILRRFAVHYETGEPMPEALLQKILAARQFNQGFATVEYTASALVDLDLHLKAGEEEIDIISFEAETLAKLGMPEAIGMRHRTPHFQHIFTGDGYSAGYYSYLWSEILDADGFDAFEEKGDIFDPELAKRLHDHVYSAGYSRDPETAYAGFRGRAPEPAALLRKRGLLDTANAQA
ncbi:M3 family metallopeptidase [Beijerinckia indica]|uniref:Peptidyl-dipeptidase Dcp n=1 Tax=Beijerinckia indica subsp. indica (strain ATCC 9039 / DSM 1715 / NCIMB 8712) TaxID=395963 RepID=B2ID53_BEII9|nr:M3 family metallopeptidase [Beijerinckia indica]ACB96818.1 Peptidyl-dipeptidase Dcp [Beijerinckia indica subsp. indica ATCC 9039]